jgi:hypothetical protein
METEPTSSPRRPAVGGAEITHLRDGTSIIRLRAHRVVEGRWWPSPAGKRGLVFLATSQFDEVVSRLAVHLAASGVQTLLLRSGPGVETQNGIRDLRSAASWLALRGARRIAFVGCGVSAGAAVGACNEDPESRLCSLLSPVSAHVPVEALAHRSCVIVCGDDDAAARELARRGGDRVRLVVFPRAPEGLAEVAGDVAALWVPMIGAALD